MFLLNSCLGQFSAAHLREHPFSRSYGVILPSSLTMLLPPALGFSPHPPVSVYGTGTVYTIAAFLDRWSVCFATFVAPRNTIGLKYGFACISPPVLAPVFPFPAHTFLLCPHISDISQYRNFNLLSIGYVFRPRLRPRLTQADQLYPGNLRYSALKILTSISLLIPAFSLLSSPPLLPVWLRSANNAPLPIR